MRPKQAACSRPTAGRANDSKGGSHASGERGDPHARLAVGQPPSAGRAAPAEHGTPLILARRRAPNAPRRICIATLVAVRAPASGSARPPSNSLTHLARRARRPLAQVDSSLSSARPIKTEPRRPGEAGMSGCCSSSTRSRMNTNRAPSSITRR